jgi:hypothetical protein
MSDMRTTRLWLPSHHRHTPQLTRIARLRRKVIRADPAPFSPLPPLSSLRPKQRKIVGQILALEQGVVASMANVVDDLEAQAELALRIRLVQDLMHVLDRAAISASNGLAGLIVDSGGNDGLASIIGAAYRIYSYGYARVSATGQTLATQKALLKAAKI